MRAARQRYDDAVQRLSARVATDHPDQLLFDASAVARIAWFDHTGRFFDGALENIALDIGLRLDELAPPRDPREIGFDPTRRSSRRVLHVVTTLLPIGGHSRGVCNWIAEDVGADHDVIILAQHGFPVRDELTRRLARIGRQPLIIPEGSTPMARAQWLRSVARHHDLVVLHTDPDDVVPVVAFADAELPPVTMLNHADHVFWAGGSVADVVIHIREEARRLGRLRRPASAIHELLLSPVRPPRRVCGRTEARRRLSLPVDVPVLLAIGSSYKFAPGPDRDFLRAVGRALDRIPEGRCVLIGPDQDDLRAYGRPLHPRLSAKGVLPDPRPWQEAADVVLDPFPFGSVTALLESVMNWCVPVLSPKPTSAIVASRSEALGGDARCPADEDEWVERVVAAARGRSEAELVGLRQAVMAQYRGPVWRRSLDELLERIRPRRHRWSRLARPDALATQDDVAVALMQAQVRASSS